MGPHAGGPLQEKRNSVTTALLILGALVLAVWTSRHFAMSRALRDEPIVRADPAVTAPADAPRVTALIPARNEARNIARCLDALLAQGYPALNVIVIDDRSTDDTARIVREFSTRAPNVRLVEGAAPPEGWTGKNHALWLGAREAAGDVLLFLDADVALDPGALAAVIRRFEADRADMLSLFLRVQTTCFWEKVASVLAGSILMLHHPVRRVNNPARRDAFANGQLLMIRADAYRAIGGHEAVRSALLEDVALAQLVKGAGRRLEIAYGWDAASARMYASFADFWRGWGRIFYCGFRGRIARLALATAMVIVFTLSPYLALLYAAATLGFGAGGPWERDLLTLSAVSVGVMVSLVARMHAFSRSGACWALFNPLAGLILTALLAVATLRCIRPGVMMWKDTAYDAGRHA
jgi:cellulose synthase/poly-beta-1,6-N-acetylglucosamine synthase-like glycosyltransferase